MTAGAAGSGPGRRRIVGVALVAGLVATGCQAVGSTDPSSTPTSAATPTTTDLAAVDLRVEEVATLEQPLALAVRRNDPALFIAEKTGRVIAIRDGRVDPEPILDLSQDVSLGSEQGLLGLAFSPDGRFLYVDFTDVDGNTHVTEFAMDGDRVDTGSRREVLFVTQPYTNHNGGQLVFGPDGDLYVGLGDGGSGGDPHGNGQSLSTLLGKILRISPRPSEDRPYTIPPDNPFVDRGGALPEIWAYGLRNPWRFSFDRVTGDLWIGDVGQSEWEEVDLLPAGSAAGQNLGWNVMEGDHAYGNASPSSDMVPPIYEYSHQAGGCVVTGGYVYRGQAIPALAGAYVFADFCEGALEAIQIAGGRVVDRRLLGPVVENVSSFGEDASGELYALSLSGAVYRLVPA